MIYFLSDGENIKVGYSENVKKRINSIQVANPKKLSAELVIEGDYFLEQKIHLDLQEYRVNGEWFYISDAVKTYIDKLRDKDLRWKLGLIGQKSEINALRNARLEAQYCLEDVANDLGITKQSVYELEMRFLKGSISINNVHKFAKAIGYTFEFRFVKKVDE